MGQIITEDELIVQLGPENRNGRQVVFTNGCFDLVHPGHVRSLDQARSLGDFLVVGLNSDESVRGLKGPARPVLPQEDRAAILAALAAVDYVVVFDRATPRELLARLRPDILVKGADWNIETIAGREEVEAGGGRVVSVPLEPGFSTTSLVDELHRRALLIKASESGSSE
ncbi:MAG: D-glycero-beta-D-manno-heptose 1-phosphate adenylyltransferase [Candidatus Acidiferrales bacterium]